MAIWAVVFVAAAVVSGTFVFRSPSGGGGVLEDVIFLCAVGLSVFALCRLVFDWMKRDFRTGAAQDEAHERDTSALVK